MLFFKFTSYFPDKATAADANVDIDISSSSSSEENEQMSGSGRSANRKASNGIENMRQSFTTSLPITAAQIAAREIEFAEAYDNHIGKQKKGYFKAFRLSSVPSYLVRRENNFTNARLVGYGYIAAFYNKCGSMVVANLLDSRMIRVNNPVPARGCAVSWPWIATLHGSAHMQLYNVITNRVTVFAAKSPVEAVLLQPPTELDSKDTNSSPRIALIGHDRLVLHDVASMTKTVAENEQATNSRVILYNDLDDIPENFKPSPAICAMCPRYICIGNGSTLRVLSLRSGKQKISVTAGTTVPGVLSFATTTLARGRLVISTTDRLIVYDVNASRPNAPAVPAINEAFMVTSVRIGDKFIETGNASGQLELRDMSGKLVLASVELSEIKSPLKSSTDNLSPADSPEASPRRMMASSSAPDLASNRRSTSIIDLMKTRVNCIISTKNGWVCAHENAAVSEWELTMHKETGTYRLGCTGVHRQAGPVRDMLISDNNTIFAMVFPGINPGDIVRKSSSRLLAADESDSSGPGGKKRGTSVVDISAMRI